MPAIHIYWITSFYYRPQGKVMFSQASVILSTIGLMATRSLLILVTLRSVASYIGILSCFIMYLRKLHWPHHQVRLTSCCQYPLVQWESQYKYLKVKKRTNCIFCGSYYLALTKNILVTDCNWRWTNLRHPCSSLPSPQSSCILHNVSFGRQNCKRKARFKCTQLFYQQTILF